MKADAHGKMKTTPYYAEASDSSYSRWRTSKVMYINERLNMNAMKVSQNIELVTNCILSKNQYDSENFQVLNYNLYNSYQNSYGNMQSFLVHR